MKLNHRVIAMELGISARTLLHWKRARPQLYEFIITSYDKEQEEKRESEEEVERKISAKALLIRLGELI